jgi:hypothetical protein
MYFESTYLLSVVLYNVCWMYWKTRSLYRDIVIMIDDEEDDLAAQACQRLYYSQLMFC